MSDSRKNSETDNIEEAWFEIIEAYLRSFGVEAKYTIWPGAIKYAYKDHSFLLYIKDSWLYIYNVKFLSLHADIIDPNFNPKQFLKPLKKAIKKDAKSFITVQQRMDREDGIVTVLCVALILVIFICVGFG